MTVPRDPELPNLAAVLDGHAMAAAFERALRPFGGARVVDCVVDRAKYRPRRSASVSWRLTLRDGSRHVEQRVGGRLLPRGQSARRHVQWSAMPGLRPSPVGPAVLYLPRLDLATHWLPNDPKLTGMAWLCDSAWMQATARAMLHVDPADETSAAGVACELVQWVPEQRACARVDVRGGPPGQPSLYVKTAATASGGALDAALRALHATPAVREGRLVVPRALAWMPMESLQWQTALDGQPMADVAATADAASSARIGCAVAALHACGVDVPSTASSLTQRLQATRDTLSQVDAQWQAALDSACGALADGVSRLQALAADALLHGDLHPGNVLHLMDGRVGLVDFDGLHRGHATVELGEWIADALFRSVLQGRTPDDALNGSLAFVDGYCDARGADVDPRLLAVSTAFALLTQRAARCALTLKPGRLALVPRLIAMAERLARSKRLESLASRDAMAGCTT